MYHCNIKKLYYKVENGVNANSTIETLINIAKALEVGVDDLIK